MSGGAHRLLVVMPARNEAERVGSVVRGVLQSVAGARVLVVDDGSTDETAAVARSAGASVARLPFHLGYGGALQTGYQFALRHGFTIVVQMDADGQHRPEDVSALLLPVTSGECDLAIGSRFVQAVSGGDGSEDEDEPYEMGAFRSLGRWTLSAFARLRGLEVLDPTSGFQAMNERTLTLFTSDWYPPDYPDVDVLLLAHRRGLRLREVPVRMQPSPRPSLLHSGWMPVYYVYRMLLSLWASSAIPRSGPIPTGARLWPAADDIDPGRRSS